MWKLAILGLGLIAGSAQAYGPANVAGECLLVVKGKTYIDGKCMLSIDEDGSFRMNVGDERQPDPYFVFLNTNEDGTASAHWNGHPLATHAHVLLGYAMKKQGVCWVEARNRVCAWKVGE
jgi:hypothetical protein